MESSVVFRPIKKRAEIDLIFNSGQKIKMNHFLIKFLFLPEKSDGAGIHYLLAVPKKKTPLAISRNRIKRIMREALRSNREVATLLKRPIGMAFIYSGPSDIDFKEVSELFALALQKIVDSECREFSKE
jgi:ribonuclease P protein component